MDIAPATLDLVFGPDSIGITAENRAKTSSRMFVQSQDELAVDSSEATGRHLSAWEAFNAFGFEKLLEAITHSSAILVTDFRRPASVLQSQREQLGLSVIDLARELRLTPKDIRNAENSKIRTPIRQLERIARALGLNEFKLNNTTVESGDHQLAIRLRTLIDSKHPEFAAKTVMMLDEAAWVTARQAELQSWLFGENSPHLIKNFETDSRYGDSLHPAWWYGYRLAEATRKRIGLSSDQPIYSLKTLVEELLGVPLIQARLPKKIAGATISNGKSRGIIVNIEGENSNVWARRVTVAHELGHLLWDPDQNLSKLRVDLYRDIEQHSSNLHDHVEARANAFAVELLLPQKVAASRYRNSNDLNTTMREIMVEYGISFTSARFQVWNSLERKIPLTDIFTTNTHPTDDWIGRESYSLDLFKPESVPETRRGYFAGLVAAAQQQGLISIDSAASYLGCTIGEYTRSVSVIRGLYPLTL
ncbi:MAG: XRE family transcriptional regulator [Alphaproteobacteria bacterium]|nr:XRE family transcriptional regulator [Alphaproteobacteria bacterium]